MTSTPPGWYQDNLNPAHVRWWDGAQWTAHTQPRSGIAPQPQTPAQIAAPHDREPQATAAPVESEPAAVKVTLFNAKNQARRLQSDVDELRNELLSLKKWISDNGLHTAEDALRVERESKERIREAENAAEESVRAKEEALEAKRAESERLLAAAKAQIATVESETKAKRTELSSVLEKLIDVRSIADFQDVALYDFEHPAESSVQLKAKLDAVRREYMELVKDKKASRTTSGFTFNGSTAQGTRFLNNMSKLLLGAYNSEAENVAKAVRAGNLEASAKRLSTARDRIERQGTMISFKIEEKYHQLRLAELELAAEHLQVKALEKELEREHKAELREQKRVEAELLAQKEKLLKEQAHYQNLLATLRDRGDDEGLARVQSQLDDVQTAIDDVDYRQANTRAGYVYVISNRGAFGDDVVKIGMTRRLEPMDRVRELGDASVPFRFDVHALFFSQDAVGVENSLHKRFEKERLNKVNLRREFFRVTPEQVLDALKDSAVEVLEFTVEAEAEEHVQSLAISERLEQSSVTV